MSEKNWTFKGFSSVGGFKELYDINLVKQDIINHFNTKNGELDWNPNYGSKIQSLIFELQVGSTRQEVESDVRRVMNSEGRVNTKSISVEELDHGYMCNIEGTYVQTKEVFELELFFNK